MIHYFTIKFGVLGCIFLEIMFGLKSSRFSIVRALYSFLHD